MRASRLVQLLLLLQLRGRAPARELADELEVSVRTVYRDVEALIAAGVPLYTETGRSGGIRLLPGYRIGGLPLSEAEGRGALLAATPAIARDLGVDTAGAEAKLLTALEQHAEAAARAVRDRLLIEPDDWFRARDDVPFLLDAARAVWEARELRIAYRGTRGEREEVVQPLGLVLKGPTWYVLARGRGRASADRLYRVSRLAEASVLDHRFERPDGFDLGAAWAARKAAFVASIPTYYVHVRVAPAGEALLALLQEGTPELPLPADVARDEHGWVRLRLRFERPESAARLLLQLGGHVEVLEPAEVRQRMASTTRDLVALYGTVSGGR